MGKETAKAKNIPNSLIKALQINVGNKKRDNKKHKRRDFYSSESIKLTQHGNTWKNIVPLFSLLYKLKAGTIIN